MGIYENLEEFCGKPVVDFDPAKGISDPSKMVPRVRIQWDEGPWEDRWQAFSQDSKFGEVQELIIGFWSGDDPEMGSGNVVRCLVESAARMPKLKSLFIGDVTSEENEISWIYQTDLSPLLAAFPQLELLRARGGNGLALKVPKHDRLKTLILETGGLDRSIVQSLCKAKFPALEHLELWLGEENYGANVKTSDLTPILSGEVFPNLTYLGLCNSQIADEIAEAVADAPILEKLEVLDLSKGTLSDDGCNALLNFPLATRLKKLDIRHHYVSPACLARLEKAGITVDASDRAGDYEDGPEDRYVFCGE